MVHVLVALVVGAILATGAAFITSEVLDGVAKGAPTSQTLYNYGNR